MERRGVRTELLVQVSGGLGRTLVIAAPLALLTLLLCSAWFYVEGTASTAHLVDRANQMRVQSRNVLARAQRIAAGPTPAAGPAEQGVALAEELKALDASLDALDRGGLWKGRILPAAPPETRASIQQARLDLGEMERAIQRLADPDTAVTALVESQVASNHLAAATGEIVDVLSLHADSTRRRLLWILGAAIAANLALLVFSLWHARRDAATQRDIARTLQDTEERSHQIADHIEDAFWITSADGSELVYRNPGYEQVFGPSHSASGPKAFDWTAPVHPDDRERVRAVSRDATSGSYEIEFRVCRADGETRWVRNRGFPIEDGNGNVYRVARLASDITDKKDAAEAAARSQGALDAQTVALSLVEHQLHAVIEHLPDGVCVLGPDRAVMMCNPTGAAYLDRLDADLDELTRLAGVESAEVRVSRTTGELREQESGDAFMVSAAPISEGREGWVLVIRDVSAEHAHEAQLRQQEHLASVGQLAAGIAHDFNNLLTVMIGTAQMLERSGGLSSEQRDELRKISVQGERATDLVRQILDFSRASAVERKSLDLVPFVGEMIRMVQRILPETIVVEEDIQLESCPVRGNPSQLQQVLTNLVTNARDAMSDGGTLRIALSKLQLSPGDAPPVAGLEPGAYAAWSVSDTGRGMEPEVVAHAFEPFFTTKAPGKGTGLGLAQLYGIVMQHEGVVDLESEIDRGSTVTIYLPQSAALESVVTESSETMPMGHRETVLLVEDEKPVREALQAMLEALHYRVLPAGDGREALALFGGHRKEINAVVTDVVMPEMGGLELWAALRVRDRKVPVIAMSGYPLGTFEDDAEGTLLPEEFSGYLHKPVVLRQLAQALDSALHSDRAAS